MPTKYIGIRVPVTLVAKLDDVARAESNSISAVVRRLLTIGLQVEARRGDHDRAAVSA